MEGPRYTSGLNVQIIRQDAKNLLFLEDGKRLLIEGNCILCGFQNSANIFIDKKCKKSNFDQIGRITIRGKVTSCVFNRVSFVRIEGSAKNCAFIGIQKRDLQILEGTDEGCTLDGEPLSIVPRMARKVFSFGGPVVMQQSQGVPSIAPAMFGGGEKTTTVVQAVKTGSGSVSWSNIKIKGGMSLRGATIEVFGSGTIGAVPVTPGRYAKRPGDSSNTLYRQELSANASTSPWQVYENGEWVPARLNPTIDSCIACNANRATQICGHCFAVGYCGQECASAHWPEHFLKNEK